MKGKTHVPDLASLYHYGITENPTNLHFRFTLCVGAAAKVPGTLQS